jgi:hypothetical protein
MEYLTFVAKPLLTYAGLRAGRYEDRWDLRPAFGGLLEGAGRETNLIRMRARVRN